MKPYITALVLTFVLLTATKAVSQRVDFSGKWLLDPTKTEFGNMPHTWIYDKITIKQDSNGVTIENYFVSRQTGKDSSSVETHTYDGKVSEKTIPNIKGVEMRSTSATPSDDRRSLILTKIYELNKSGIIEKMKVTEVWILSKDGKELSINKTFTNSPTTIKAVYNKL